MEDNTRLFSGLFCGAWLIMSFGMFGVGILLPWIVPGGPGNLRTASLNPAPFPGWVY